MILLIIGLLAFVVVYILQTVFLAMYLRSMFYPEMGALVVVQAFGLLLWIGLIVYSWCNDSRPIKCMWIVWAIYSVGFVASVAAIFSQDVGKLDKSEFFGPNVLKSTLCLAPVLLVLLFNTTISARKNPKLIERISIAIAIDLFDGIEMLEVLILYRGKELDIPNEIAWAILSFASLCFLVSAIALCEHKFKFRGYSGEVENRPCVTVLRASIQILCVNLPFLILRGILWSEYNFGAPIFITKNALSIASCIIDIIYICTNGDTTEEFDLN